MLPKNILKHTVKISERTGHTGFTEVTTRPVDVVGNFQLGTQKITDDNGETIIAKAMFMTNEKLETLTPGGTLIFEAVEYEIMKIDRLDNPLVKSNIFHHTELVLR